MDAQHLVFLALARLPRPYTAEVTLRVFCEIERTPHLRKAYKSLLKHDYTKDGLNKEIGKAVKRTLNAKSGARARKLRCGDEVIINVEDICPLVKSFTLLRGRKPGWMQWE